MWHSQILKLQRQGKAAVEATHLENLPNIVVDEEFEALGFDMPVTEHNLLEDHAHALDESESNWEEDGEDEGLLKTKEKMWKSLKREYKDFRTCRDQTDRTWINFKSQLDEITTACMDWVYVEKHQPESCRVPKELMDLNVVDIFGSSTEETPLFKGLIYDSSSIILSGLLPTTPLSHKSAITTRTVALYHSLFVRCPKLGIQPSVKALCDAQGSLFKPYLATQMSVAFDLYVAILNGVCFRVRKALGCDGPNWRMLNCCPPCQYRLEGEEKLPVCMLASFDGNDSLKQVEHTNDCKHTGAEVGTALVLGPSREQIDHYVGGGDNFLQPNEVDAWDEENWEFVNELDFEDGQLSPERHLWAEGQCEERWHNAKDKNTACSVGKFLECRWFAFLCQHMMLLIACDMIRSSEQSKYPLSVLNRYMAAELEERKVTKEGRPEGALAIAYDIHCKFSKTVKQSPLKNLVEWCNYLPVIGTMHGYAHERAFQLLFLMLYIVGTGIKDGEPCEHYFSVTNALAGITRHQSIFHCRQAIAEFIYHQDNFETYSKSSLFIYNNYKQALGLLKTRHAVAKAMKESRIEATETFYEWLVEEGEYLHSLSKAPPEETLEMEYFLKLEALYGCIKCLKEVRIAWQNYIPNGGHNQGAALEKKCWNEMENERKLIADCQVLEWKLKIKDQWMEDSEKWCVAKKMLEGLLVARMFEMTRLNVAGTGYKMRKHIANALKLQSKSIQSAIAAYNETAAALSPPRQCVSWEEVLEFSYLSEFDILWDTREDIRGQKWATQKNRMLMQEFFKLIRAKNELPRLHVEIRRLFTYMRDEEQRLNAAAKDLEETDPALALQVILHWQEHGCFNDIHCWRLLSIKRLDGFDFSNNKYFWPGIAVAKEAPLQGFDSPSFNNDPGSDVEEENDDNDIEGELDKALSVATDLD
ncbi:hypothetical protein BT96DRAFT_1001317 [Gymnopus androsaceus JB14]|uniref:CxC2-like cysteine cluster KDZ transposase-associated domain-containing protein n=1 Tax=Gymnopus androsaceus JB14 TaxID=1447944 RepID=A0A6A4H129_9AGAR|nr:hypothetical protein BT96DRAFT_1001317 [Gymnopus androsaceus JB14]